MHAGPGVWEGLYAPTSTMPPAHARVAAQSRSHIRRYPFHPRALIEPLAPRGDSRILSAMLRFLAALLLASATSLVAAEVARIAPADAAKLVADGQAVLVDVREPAEWLQTGVAAPAVLLPQSDFEHDQFEWKPFLAKVAKDKTLILYCRSGRRSGMVGAALAEKGYKVVNAGGLKDWIAASLPTRQIDPKK